MAKLFTICLSIGLLTACTPATRALGNLPTPTVAFVGAGPGTPAKTSTTPSSQITPTGAGLSSLYDSCGLLNTRDLAGFFASHNETILPKPQISPIDHPAFSTGNASGIETSCVYYTFHQPGSHTVIALQVNYWLDQPASAAEDGVWVQDWSEAKDQAAQALPDIADGAFYKDGRLSFKKNDVYVTVEAIETDWNLNGSIDAGEQLAVEKQVALDVLDRLKQ